MDLISDGEIHSLNDKYFYILEEYLRGEAKNLKSIKRKFLDKYIWYLFSVDFTHSEIEDIINSGNRFKTVHIKPFDGESRPYGTYFMKFKKENR